MTVVAKAMKVGMGIVLAISVSGCQVQNGGSTTGFRLIPNAQSTTDSALQFASIEQIPLPGSRPYSRTYYRDDIALDIVPNPKIDAVTGREISLLSTSVRRRQAALPFNRRSNLYNAVILRHARMNGIDYEFAKAVIYSESSFRVNALGGHGEIGLMQVKPSTARAMGYRGTRNELYLPENNIKFGMKYLRRAKEKGDGTTCGTILKYNAGLYAKRMNPISARYCAKVKRLMKQARGRAVG